MRLLWDVSGTDTLHASKQRSHRMRCPRGRGTRASPDDLRLPTFEIPLSLG